MQKWSEVGKDELEDSQERQVAPKSTQVMCLVRSKLPHHSFFELRTCPHPSTCLLPLALLVTGDSSTPLF